MTVITLDTSVSPLPGSQGGTGVSNSGKTLTLGASTTINSSGFISTPARSLFMATLSADQPTVTGSGVAYNIMFDGAPVNTGGNFNTSTGRYIVPNTGQYLFTGGVGLANIQAAHTNIYLAVTRTTGGSLTYYLFDCNPDSAAITVSGAMIISGSCIMNLNSNDAIALQVFGSGSTAVIGVTASTTFFSGFQIA